MAGMRRDFQILRYILGLGAVNSPSGKPDAGEGRFNMRMTSRRGFLRAAGGAAAARAAAQEPGETERKRIGYAVVGLGRLAQGQVLPAFAKSRSSRVTALVSGDPAKAERLAGQYGVNPKNIYNYQTYDRLASNPDVQAIYIALPNGMHAEYTIRGARAGKHILVEKPMANSPEECREMIEACRAAGRKLMVAYRCRFEPYNMTAIRMVREGTIGKLKVFASDHGFNIGDPTQWRLNRKLAGGGSLMDIGIYALQAARYITGEEPVEISAQMYSTPGDPRFREVEETILFLLRFPGGVLADCSSSYGYAGQNRYRAIGDKGWLELEPATSYTGLRLRVRKGNVTEEHNLPQVDHFAAEMDHFAEAILNNTEIRTPGEDGLQDLKLMMAIYEAARTGRTVRVAG
jgi:predicted dehydrogenase